MAGERLILTGFMGMGKSTVGPLAAEKLEVKYYDTDEWMENEAGIDVPHLVKTDPAKFRRVESQALNDILGQEPGVISTGGGIVSTEIGRKALMDTHVLVIWLNAPFEVAAERVASDATGRERPLFSDYANAKKLYEERQEWYEATHDVSLDAAQPREDVVAQIVATARWWYQD